MKRGRKPQSVKLHLVNGTFRADRHGSEEKQRAEASKSGKLSKPPWLKGDGAKAWKKWIDPATWLDIHKEPAAIAFCTLWAEFQRAPTAFQAAKHTQMRAYMSELGLSDPRNRAEPEHPQDDFFDD